MSVQNMIDRNVSYLDYTPRFKRISNGVFPFMLQQTDHDANIKIYAVPFNISLVIPDEAADGAEPQDALGTLFSSSVADKILATDVSEVSSIKDRRLRLDHTNYITINGVSLRHNIDFKSNRIALANSKMSNYVFNFSNMKSISTEAVIKIAKTIYVDLMQENDNTITESYLARFSQAGCSSAIVVNSQEDFGKMVDRLTSLEQNGVWQFKEIQGISVRWNTLDAHEWVRWRIEQLMGQNVCLSNITNARNTTLSELVHIVSVYTIYYLLRDFCFGDIIVENKDITESVDRFFSTLDSRVAAEYKEARESGSDFADLQARQDNDLNSTIYNTYIGGIVVDILRLLERLYYGVWIIHENEDLLCDFTVQNNNTRKKYGLTDCKQNMFSTLPRVIEANIVKFGGTVLDSNDVMLLITNINKIIDNVEASMSGVLNNPEMIQQNSVNLSDTICNIIRTMPEYEKVSSIVMHNPNIGFTHILRHLRKDPNELNSIHDIIISAVDNMFLMHYTALVNSEIRTFQGENPTKANNVSISATEEHLHHALHSAIELLIFAVNQMNTIISNLRIHQGNISTAALSTMDISTTSLSKVDNTVHQKNVILNQEENLLYHMIRVDYVPAFNYGAFQNLCSFDINLDLMRGMIDLIDAFNYFVSAKDLYTKYDPGSAGVETSVIDFDWFLKVLDSPVYAFMLPSMLSCRQDIVNKVEMNKDKAMLGICRGISARRTIEVLFNAIKFKNCYAQFIKEQISIDSNNKTSGFFYLIYNKNMQLLFKKMVKNAELLGDFYGNVQVGYKQCNGLEYDKDNYINRDYPTSSNPEYLTSLNLPAQAEFAENNIKYAGVFVCGGLNRDKSLQAIENGNHAAIGTSEISQKRYLITKERTDEPFDLKRCGQEVKGTNKERFINLKKLQYVAYDTRSPEKPSITSDFSIMKPFIKDEGEKEQISLLYNISNLTNRATKGAINPVINSWVSTIKSKLNYCPKYNVVDAAVAYTKDSKMNFDQYMDYDFANLPVQKTEGGDFMNFGPAGKNIGNYSSIVRRLCVVAEFLRKKAGNSGNYCIPVRPLPVNVDHAANLYNSLIDSSGQEYVDTSRKNIQIYQTVSNMYGGVDLDLCQVTQEEYNQLLLSLDILSLTDLLNQEIELINMENILLLYDIVITYGNYAMYQNNPRSIFNELTNPQDINRASLFFDDSDINKIYLPYTREIAYSVAAVKRVSHINLKVQVPVAIYDKLRNSNEYSPTEYRFKETAQPKSSRSNTATYGPVSNKINNLRGKVNKADAVTFNK